MSHTENMRAAQLLRDRIAKARYASTPGLTHMAGNIKVNKEHEAAHWGKGEGNKHGDVK